MGGMTLTLRAFSSMWVSQVNPAREQTLIPECEFKNESGGEADSLVYSWNSQYARGPRTPVPNRGPQEILGLLPLHPQLGLLQG